MEASDFGDTDIQASENSKRGSGGIYGWKKKERVHVRLALVGSVESSCLRYDVKKYPTASRHLWKVLLVGFRKDRVGEKITVGRIH